MVVVYLEESVVKTSLFIEMVHAPGSTRFTQVEQEITG